MLSTSLHYHRRKSFLAPSCWEAGRTTMWRRVSKPWQIAMRPYAPPLLMGPEDTSMSFKMFSVSNCASLRPGLRSLDLTGLDSRATRYSTLSKLSTNRLSNVTTRGLSSCPAKPLVHIYAVIHSYHWIRSNCLRVRTSKSKRMGICRT
jgi:hypothetical protein